MTEEDPGCGEGCTGEGPTALGKEDGVGFGASFGVGAGVDVDVGASFGSWTGFGVGMTTATGCCLMTGDLAAITAGAGSGTEEPSTEIFRPSETAWVV